MIFNSNTNFHYLVPNAHIPKNLIYSSTSHYVDAFPFSESCKEMNNFVNPRSSGRGERTETAEK